MFLLVVQSLLVVYGDGSNLTGIEAFVKGMIILWYGDTNNVPTGFALFVMALMILQIER